jgi:hypothetical protein
MVESGVKHHKLSEIYQHFLKHINSRDTFISKLDKKYKNFRNPQMWAHLGTFLLEVLEEKIF